MDSATSGSWPVPAGGDVRWVALVGHERNRRVAQAAQLDPAQPRARAQPLDVIGVRLWAKRFAVLVHRYKPVLAPPDAERQYLAALTLPLTPAARRPRRLV